jgi:phosphodiesterase/alkaline phosphatase D-like protein
VALLIHATEEGGEVSFSLEAHSNGEGAAVTMDLAGISAGRASGGLALASHTPEAGRARAWFSGIRVEGEGAEFHPERKLGPILGAQHTLSRGVLKLTAQLFPLAAGWESPGSEAPDSVLLEIADDGGRWTRMASAAVIIPGYTATFRVPDWPAQDTVLYRLSHRSLRGDGTGEAVGAEGLTFSGSVRADPKEKEEIVVAAFTGNHNVASPGVDGGSFDWSDGVWFPHEDILGSVRAHHPDFLFFSGDQVYEGASPTRADYDQPYPDYLYKWYLWLWAFRDLTADIPSVALPDDHDVFHGNVWGAGGRATPPELSGANAQDQGGYRLPPEWVNMVQRTQASHLPDPWDPQPVEQGIEVYFTDILYGGVSFAVVEDRKFKSPPKLLLPQASVWNGWAQNPDFDAATQSDVPGAALLGPRQEEFLEAWAGDWSDGAWMKVLLSQTIFANVATIPADAMNGSVIPTLPIPEPGAWVEGDRLAADMDSNGWPPSGRNRALRSIRKGFAVHLAGDQHLGSTIQYGIDSWRDGPFALCVPSVANFWPRRWYPPEPGGNRDPGTPAYAGDHRDGFGNYMTVLAVSNPARWDMEPALLHNRAPGYGIARFRRSTREITLEAWPRWAEPGAGEPPYPGWPVRFSQEDGYGRDPWGFLPTLEVVGMTDPVVQVVSEPSGEVVYTLRIRGTHYSPAVFTPGTYALGVGEPGTDQWRVMIGLAAAREPPGTVEIRFQEGVPEAEVPSG